MDVVVLVKYVPDAQEPRSLVGPGWRLDRPADTGRLSELDEYAMEAALQLVEAEGGTVTALTLGPGHAGQAARSALQLGADDAVHVSDDALAGSDVLGTAAALAAAVRRLAPDLVITGMGSTDAGTGVVPAALAELLGWPLLALADTLALEDGPDGPRVRADRDAGREVVTSAAPVPAVVSVTDRFAEPRYPSFRTIMAAKKKTVQEWGLAELAAGGDPQSAADLALAGAGAARTRVTDAAPRPPRSAGRRMVDPDQAPAVIADVLTELELL